MRKPTLYHKGKSGAVVQWDIWTEGATIFVAHGQIGGKIQKTPGTVCTGKNIGKANETSPAQQADLEAEAMWVNKRDRKYSETPEAAEEEVFLPMLAADFKKRIEGKKHGIVFPVDVQPKLDGTRAMAFWDNGRLVLGTRGGKEWTAPAHIIKELEKYMPEQMVLDGELYIHGALFEDLASWTKKKYPETATLEYHVYDMPIDANGIRHPWAQRRENLENFMAETNLLRKMVKPVEVINVETPDLVLKAELMYVGAGYEGAMVRTRDHEYTFGHRSNFLLKVKSTIDAEYKITGFKEGDGKDAGCVIWECVTPGGLTFDVRPKTTLAKRAILFKEGKKHIGEWLKVRYNNLTAENKPRFPRSVGFRDERDM